MVAKVDYVVVGHVTADLVAEDRVLGGPASFASLTARAFGLRVGVLTSAAHDELLLAEMGDVQVVNVPAAHTTTYRNIYQGGTRMQYVSAVAEPLTAAHVPDVWQDAPLVQIAPVADEIDADVADVFQTDRLLLTPQGWMRRWDAQGRVDFKRWYNPHLLARALVTVLSEEDITAQPWLEAEYAAAADWLVITRGERGGTSYRQGVPSHYAAVPGSAVDVTGAGDVFAAALLVAWDRLQDVDAALHVAAALASHSIMRRGPASVPTRAEVTAALP